MQRGSLAANALSHKFTAGLSAGNTYHADQFRFPAREFRARAHARGRANFKRSFSHGRGLLLVELLRGRTTHIWTKRGMTGSGRGTHAMDNILEDQRRRVQRHDRETRAIIWQRPESDEIKARVSRAAVYQASAQTDNFLSPTSTSP